jgi:hypothetical protein
MVSDEIKKGFSNMYKKDATTHGGAVGSLSKIGSSLVMAA